ncbi:hypothetical protein I2494_20090 [Budviciaceae bacterium BWR-B9]|uniref:Uncharacterized protein n=2 Tax=Budviciaceae TaxID=1903416 RepID=A0ABS1IW41_9GAMM|nr:MULTISPECIES: hypothetical protein [Limnobaculum]MBK5145973.1 hypothetical protein [Limnobaculum allomyrinae]MBV7693972.1 hypothetical protein [Limnobaculum sp. M2-1]
MVKKMMNKNELYRKALQRYGADAQLAKLAEEASELSAAVIRNLLCQGDERAMAEEIADIEIMIEQHRQNGMGQLIDFFKQQKLERLNQLLKDGGI